MSKIRLVGILVAALAVSLAAPNALTAPPSKQPPEISQIPPRSGFKLTEAGRKCLGKWRTYRKRGFNLSLYPNGLGSYFGDPPPNLKIEARSTLAGIAFDFNCNATGVFFQISQDDYHFTAKVVNKDLVMVAREDPNKPTRLFRVGQPQLQNRPAKAKPAKPVPSLSPAVKRCLGEWYSPDGFGGTRIIIRANKTARWDSHELVWRPTNQGLEAHYQGDSARVFSARILKSGKLYVAFSDATLMMEKIE